MLLPVQGALCACTYLDIDSDLYDCFSTEGIYTEYVLPYMSDADATTFCRYDFLRLYVNKLYESHVKSYTVYTVRSDSLICVLF